MVSGRDFAQLHTSVILGEVKERTEQVLAEIMQDGESLADKVIVFEVRVRPEHVEYGEAPG